MDCQAFDHRLDTLLDGTCSEEAWREAEAHLRGCARCRQLFEALSGGADDLGASGHEALAGSVLARTTGSTCGSARDRLCDFVDGALDRVDHQLVDAHVARCAPCAELARALRLAADALPAFAELTPPASLADACLRATSRRPPAPSWDDRLARWFARLAARPRFSFEVAYLFTIILVVAFGNPVKAFRDSTSRAATLVRPRVEVAIGRIASPVRHVRALAVERMEAAATSASTQPASGASWRTEAASFARHLWDAYVVGAYRAVIDRLGELVAAARRAVGGTTGDSNPPARGRV